MVGDWDSAAKPSALSRATMDLGLAPAEGHLADSFSAPKKRKCDILNCKQLQSCNLQQ
jgi:hypothetical protein